MKIGQNNTREVDFSGLNAKIEVKKATDALGAFTDLAELNRYAGNGLYRMGWDGIERLQAALDGCLSDDCNDKNLNENSVKFPIVAILQSYAPASYCCA